MHRRSQFFNPYISCLFIFKNLSRLWPQDGIPNESWGITVPRTDCAWSANMFGAARSIRIGQTCHHSNCPIVFPVWRLHETWGAVNSCQWHRKLALQREPEKRYVEQSYHTTASACDEQICKNTCKSSTWSSLLQTQNAASWRAEPMFHLANPSHAVNHIQCWSRHMTCVMICLLNALLNAQPGPGLGGLNRSMMATWEVWFHDIHTWYIHM